MCSKVASKVNTRPQHMRMCHGYPEIKFFVFFFRENTKQYILEKKITRAVVHWSPSTCCVHGKLEIHALVDPEKLHWWRKITQPDSQQLAYHSINCSEVQCHSSRSNASSSLIHNFITGVLSTASGFDLDMWSSDASIYRKYWNIGSISIYRITSYRIAHGNIKIFDTPILTFWHGISRVVSRIREISIETFSEFVIMRKLSEILQYYLLFRISESSNCT